MKQILLFFCLLLPFYAYSADDEIENFLDSRQLVTQIKFAKQSVALSTLSMRQIDAIVPQLQNLTEQKRLVRVEGFASPEGEEQANIKLSLQRALAVENYLLQAHKLKSYVFLTGFGEKGKPTARLTDMRRVDIAIYHWNRAAEALFDEMAPGNVERYILQ